MSFPAKTHIALGLVALSIGCAHRPPRNIQEIRGGGPRPQGSVAIVPGNSLRAESTFARSLGECTYIATLRGHVDEVHYGSAGAPFGILTYSPIVTIATEVTCGSDRPVVRATRGLETEGLNAEGMAQSISETGEIQVPVGQRTCTFRPAIAVSGDSVFIANVDESCER